MSGPLLSYQGVVEEALREVAALFIAVAVVAGRLNAVAVLADEAQRRCVSSDTATQAYPAASRLPHTAEVAT